MIIIVTHRSLAVALALLVTIVAHAAQDRGNTSSSRLEDLPAGVQKTVRDAAQDATVRQITKSPETYTARIDTNGQKSEVRVTPLGKVLRSRSKHEAEAQYEEEQRLAQAGRLNTVSLEAVPLAAREVIAGRAKGGKIDQIVRAPATYTAVIENSGDTRTLQVTDDGKILANNPR